MKTARILLLLVILLLIAIMSKAQGKQKPKRYFAAIYISTDSITGSLHYGTYYWTMTNGGFANRHEIYKLIIDDFKIKCRESEFRIIPIEFKNKKEWLKFNDK